MPSTDKFSVICAVCGETFGKHSASYDRCPTYQENGTRGEWAKTRFVPREDRMIFNSTTEEITDHD